jgi:hypothetical protein
MPHALRKPAAQVFLDGSIREIESAPVSALRERDYKTTYVYALVLESEPIVKGPQRAHLAINPVRIPSTIEIGKVDHPFGSGEPVIAQEIVTTIPHCYRLKAGHLQRLLGERLDADVWKSDVDNQSSFPS